MLSLQGSMGGSTREDNLFALPVYRYWSSVPSWLNQTQQKVWLNMDSTFDLPFTQTQKDLKGSLCSFKPVDYCLLFAR